MNSIRVSLTTKNVFFIISFFLITFFVFYIISDLIVQSDRSVLALKNVTYFNNILLNFLKNADPESWPKIVESFKKSFPFFRGCVIFYNNGKKFALGKNYFFLKKKYLPSTGVYYYQGFFVLVSSINKHLLWVVYNSHVYPKSSNKKVFLLVGFVLLFFALMMALFVSQIIISPLKKILIFSEKVTQGELEEKLHLSTGDEIEELAMAIEKMKDALARQIATLKEQSAFIEKVFSLISAGIVVLDEKFQIIKCNHLLSQFFPHEVLEENKLQEFLKDNFIYSRFVSEDLPVDLEKLEEGTYEIREKKGKKRFIFSFAKLVDQSEETKYILVFNDITLLKEYEQLIQQMQRTSWVGELNLRLAHEIKNPLVTMSSLSQLMLEEENIDVEERKEMLGKIVSESHRLVKILEEFSSLFKGEVAELNLKKVNLQELIGYLLEFLKYEFKEHGIKVEFSLPDKEILVDEVKFKQVIFNIIKNAIDVLKLKDSPERNLYICMENEKLIIANNGEKISEDRLQRIFVPFYSTKERGSGLGLTIVKELCDKMGIGVEVLSNEEKTTFQFDLGGVILDGEKTSDNR